MLWEVEGPRPYDIEISMPKKNAPMDFVLTPKFEEPAAPANRFPFAGDAPLQALENAMRVLNETVPLAGVTLVTGRSEATARRA